AVLAIVAEKLGAKQVIAIDIDHWAFENALENIQRNNCTKIEAKLGEVEHLVGLQSDVFLANINRNILVNQAQVYTQVCNSNSFLLLSGFYETDAPHLLNAFPTFTEVSRKTKEDWCMLILQKN
ncbi:MAG: 50S ribosomal protein L11 methyltransferase, partial [Bacteroidota bacterium]